MAAVGIFGSEFPALNYVDMSRWGGPFEDHEVACMRARGVTAACVATGPGNYSLYSRQQAETASRHGLWLDGYAYQEYGADPVGWALDAVRDLDRFDVRMFWPDFEDTVNGRDWSVARRIEYCARALEVYDRELGRARVGWYGAGWYHRGYLGDTWEFADRALWDAWYPAGADAAKVLIQPWQGRPYGGFSEPAIYQYAGTTVLCGQSVDLNWARHVAQKEEDEMDPRVDKLIRLLSGADEALIDDWLERGNAPLLADYAANDVDGHVAQHAAAQAHQGEPHAIDGEGLPEHSHEPGAVRR